jgi:hypothetical protein
MAIIQRQSTFAFRHVKLGSETRSGPAPYERLSASHAGLDPLAPIKRELREIDDAIVGLKDEATQSSEAQKYAKTMLKLLTSRRTDLLAMKQKWLQAA